MTNDQQFAPSALRVRLSPSHLEWALLLLALATAVALRFWQLGQFPAGLYRDEAFNGLDAVDVLQGQRPLFFSANNGREPIYIYLTSVAIALFGQTTLAVRLAAAVVGSLTTIPVYLLGKSWFSGRVGILAAFVWAITLWPVHLSRIGLRVILLAPLLALTFWLGTIAYRRGKKWLWLLAGVVYGLCFYTYLAARFTPILLLLLAVYMLLTRRGKGLWPGAVWFGVGTAVALAPLLPLIMQQPDLVWGRSGQVAIWQPAVNGGNLWQALWVQTGRALGMFLWRGDSILRHNPAGRPVFDWFMIVPFLSGVLYCLRHWRRPAAMAILLWMGVMLGPTILAADTPHFLRAVGVLPGIIFLPALGLEWLTTWPRLPAVGRTVLPVLLLIGSFLLTIRDYTAYGYNPEVAYLFENAASDLATQINAEAPETAVFVHERFWSNWPSVSFLVKKPQQVIRFKDDHLPSPISTPAAFYLWPYESLDFVPKLIVPPGQIAVSEGALARGDLEESPYPLFVRYTFQDQEARPLAAAPNFAGQLRLSNAKVTTLADQQLQVDLMWQTESAVSQDLTVFVHIIDPDGTIVGQTDAPLAHGRWPRDWWQPELAVVEQHLVALSRAYDPTQQQVIVGLYDNNSGERLSLLDEVGQLSRETAVTIAP